MKVAPFFTGIVLGIAAGFALAMALRKESPGTDSEQADTVSLAEKLSRENRQLSGETRQLREENLRLAGQVDKLQDRISAYEEAARQGQDLEAVEKARWIAFRLREYLGLFDLTGEQAAQIGEWEWEEKLYWDAFREKRQQPDPRRIPLTDRVRSILSPEQQEVYDAQLEAKAESMAQMGAQSILSRYPITLNLSEEQKDSIFQNLYRMHHQSTANEYMPVIYNLSKSEGIPYTEAQLILAGEDILNDDQMRLLREIISASPLD